MITPTHSRNHFIFPELFPYYSKGDITYRDRVCEVAKAESKNHSLKHFVLNEVTNDHAHPLAERNRWMHWVQSTSDRHRANGE